MTILGALMGFLLFSSGAMALPTHAMAPKAPASPSHVVTLTAYNAVPEQTDGDPLVTASGAYSNPEVVAARSQDLADELPFGTIIEIIGPSNPENNCGYSIVEPIVGYRVIADVMNARYTKRIDLLFSTKSNYLMSGNRVKNAGHVLGICNGSAIRVVGHVGIHNIPKTQAELVAIVEGRGTALAIN